MQMMLSLSQAFFDHHFRYSAAWEVGGKRPSGALETFSFVPKTADIAFDFVVVGRERSS